MSTRRSPLLSALRGGCGLAAAAGLLACLAGAAELPTLAGPEAGGPAGPATSPAPATTAPAGTIAQRIVPTPQEKAIFVAIEDRTNRSDEASLAAMVSLAGRAPRLEPIQWWDLDRPAYANLVGSPRRYRATPLVMRVRVFLVRKLQPGAGLDFPPTWPADRVLWEMDCVEADTPFQKNKPIGVYSLVDPAPFIGSPADAGEQGRRVYPSGPEVRVAALFYRLRHNEEPATKLPDIPELVVWQISKANSPAGGDLGVRTGLGKPTWVIVLGIGTIVLYYITKRRVAKARQSNELAVPRRQTARPEQAAVPGQDESEKEGENGTNRHG